MEHVSSVRPTGKLPEKVENLKRWFRFPGWNFRTECRVPFTFLVVCTSSRSRVGHRHVPGFTTKWNNFLPIGNSTFASTEISGVFFLNGGESAPGLPKNFFRPLGPQFGLQINGGGAGPPGPSPGSATANSISTST